MAGQLDWPTWLASINLLQIAIVVLAVVFVIRFLVKFWPWLRKLIRLIDSLGQLPDFIDRTDKRIAEIHHEVNYNNGSSVKDAVSRAEKAVERVETGVAGLYTRMDKSDSEVAELRADLENTQPKQIKE